MEPLKLNADERIILRDLRDSEGFKVMARVMQYETDVASWSLNNANSDHRYYQGRLHSLFQLQNRLEEYSKPEKVKVEEPNVPWMISKPSSTTDY